MVWYAIKRVLLAAVTVFLVAAHHLLCHALYPRRPL